MTSYASYFTYSLYLIFLFLYYSSWLGFWTASQIWEQFGRCLRFNVNHDALTTFYHLSTLDYCSHKLEQSQCNHYSILSFQNPQSSFYTNPSIPDPKPSAYARSPNQPGVPNLPQIRFSPRLASQPLRLITHAKDPPVADRNLPGMR